MTGRPRRRTLTPRGRGFVGAGVVLAIAGVVLGFEDIVRVGVLLVALALLALAFARRPAAPLTVQRTVTPETVMPDQRAEVQVTFTNTGRRASSLYLAEERVDYVLGDRPRFVLPRTDAGGTREVGYVVRSQLRGRYPLGPVTLHQRDPFGLTSVTRTVDGVGELLVLPRVVPLGSSHPPGAGLGSEGETPQMVALHGEEDVSIRGYHDGDDLRKVHWPATAHRGELMVRQEDRPARRSAIVVLDSRESGHRGSGAAGSFEWAVSAAASIVVRLEELGYQLHLATRESMVAHTFEGAQGAAQLVHDLASADVGADLEFGQVVSHAHELVRLGGLVTAIVTPHDESLLGDLAAMRQPGAAALGFVLDTDTFAGAAGPTPQAAAVRDRLAAAGWRVVVVDARTSIPQAWATVSNRALVQVGSL
ncbi:DUF58 domain-containing protein [Flexivirga sp. ID2601S]|uniref:DUF58 domain-containing protein n=1 Tax=Flexivirga aerilata TaxID=1656889 RepID=A0A849AIF4_9MICO|nr:DUF58 domain-containing protein [Flexivirga aerilata]NNG39627.1 DUF58 domain-containing protein [Flexivirga aerilata]